MDTQWAMTHSMSVPGVFSSRKLISSWLRIIPYLMISAQPSASTWGDRVASTLVSHRTRWGWVKVPTRFLPSGRSTAVLPPTEESTTDSKEVGSCTQGMPRRYREAASPAMSPVTPPPRANTPSDRVMPFWARQVSSWTRVSVFLDCSPAGNMKWST